jgi:hypothetical protein
MSAASILSAAARGVGVVFVVAGAYKAYDLDAFAQLLVSPFPPAAAPPEPLARALAWTVAVGELFLGVVLALAVGGRRPRWAAISVLAVYCGFLLAMTAMRRPPPCNCLPQLIEYASARRQAAWGVVRNAAMIALLLAGLLWRPRRPLAPADNEKPPPAPIH